ncbi:hypothetical protein GLOIN_2v1595937 [Rhizophagus irregularis DAOM 181602=DAOM 197198]|uniref:Uncharacterized protein n=1 Tax=Rhizophagus irregularis (strain DAOM 181602 / DAOM 197198 / MUCL 43194) TaxID=747089 RepID=A0A2P4Q419_RHIID|nr:hypothetical protein GLOIN_2v1595937 [Rhizophagus irregularis DAOM 181602=DAOM 197198]POG72348.1 hypothetical protein GLOIN_2v1595937 [Rhizophagus irregularis DAOM 181602=DAOM 197198]GET51731.1 hypothetical protein GLOIN_2v1595937 [Rhizophagus irregularis DAOM 181602=DAOM 197198]|eukprot:XP_025179214.1 hypothetical protein GLOIN_2v1595937 [Rhizophagus irregularis DAOM 181602=DAOM 197198]
MDHVYNNYLLHEIYFLNSIFKKFILIHKRKYKAIFRISPRIRIYIKELLYPPIISFVPFTLINVTVLGLSSHKV